MSFLRQISPLVQLGNTLRSPVGSLTHIRTATKKVSGSRTNKNDSAGRRLGPKAYENQFVQPGEIIMRQRGTKIHPGDNVGIGKDHTIFALEPGYVRFYLDPFHPLRKFVGVALRKDLTLPAPHFEPRVRRFGYIPLEGEEADKEEAHMSRKEYLAQPELLKRAEKEAEASAQVLAAYTKVVAAKLPQLSAENVKLGASRLQFVANKLSEDESHELAYGQATYNYIYDLDLAVRRGELSSDEADSKKTEYLSFVQDFDSKLSVDFNGVIYKTLSEEARSARKEDISSQLAKFANKKIGPEDKKTILGLISEGGVFSRKERIELKRQYLPKVLPVTVPGTVLENPGKKLPKDAVPVRIYNPEDRSVQTIVRTKDAFLA